MKQIADLMKARNMTQSSINTYVSILVNFFKHTKKANNLNQTEINNYLNYLMVVKNYKARSRNMVAKVIRFYCREFDNFVPEINKVKEDRSIPKICEDSDYNRIISITTNPKHQLCLHLMRYSGLRRWEVIRVMKHHIMDDGRLFVKAGKGKKDRYTIIPNQILEQLQSYISLLPADNPYVFQGQKGGYYSTRTPQAILDNAFDKLKLYDDQRFGCHALRHAFTIWALETLRLDTDMVSKMLGHSITQTTQIYTQCRKLNLHRAIEVCSQVGIMQ